MLIITPYFHIFLLEATLHKAMLPFIVGRLEAMLLKENGIC